MLNKEQEDEHFGFAQCRLCDARDDAMKNCSWYQNDIY
jgi:hypothetical protein